MVDETIEITINPADLRIDTFRSSGAGGQHVNKTESAIRITHLPTNIVVQCQNDRSQHRNRAEAMTMLKSRLYEAELRKRQEEKQAREDSKTDIGWGHQIRSYVLDQSRIKDLRTNVEIGNTKLVPRQTPPTDDLRTIAASRLLLDNFPHIEAYRVMIGEETASVALHFGASDVNGTLEDEKIAHAAKAASPAGLAQEQILRIIRDAGKIAVERDALYNVVKVWS